MIIPPHLFPRRLLPLTSSHLPLIPALRLNHPDNDVNMIHGSLRHLVGRTHLSPGVCHPIKCACLAYHVDVHYVIASRVLSRRGRVCRTTVLRSITELVSRGGRSLHHQARVRQLQQRQRHAHSVRSHRFGEWRRSCVRHRVFAI